MAVDVNAARRKFLGTSIGAGAATVIGTHCGNAAAAPAPNPGQTYPVIPIASVEHLTAAVAKSFNYPDEHSPCMLVRLDSGVAGGVGPEKNIVAYSSMCTHMGCFISYDDATETFQCPCHFSVFDPGNNGQMVCGQATESLPRIELRHDQKTGQIVATGIHGRLYGRISNIL